MKPIRTGVRWPLSLCAAVLASSAIADIPSAAHECAFDLVETTSSSDFTALEGGAVVRHERTGLVWRRCAEGMSWSGTDCAGNATLFNWQDALQHADATAGWRLPSINELRSIVERCRSGPTINQKVFPGTPGAWSASPYSGNSGEAWGVNFFSTGDDYPRRNVLVSTVRLVRGGQ